MRIRDKIANEVVNPINKLNVAPTIGIVIKYYSNYNVADVQIKSPGGGSATELKGVPVCIPPKGFKQYSIKENDRVYIQFDNDSFFMPKIISLADESYEKETKLTYKHNRKGSYITDNYENKKYEGAFLKKVINKENSKELKYINYRMNNSLADLNKTLKNVGTFEEDDVAMYNPINSSIVKIDKEGNVSIFISTNVGIKLDTKDKKVKIYGDIEYYPMKEVER